MSVRQKVESQNGGNKKTKHAKFSEKLTFLTPQRRTRTCAYQWVKNVRFFRKIWRVLFFCDLRFEICLFCRITDDMLFDFPLADKIKFATQL